MPHAPLFRASIPGRAPLHSGKVRELFDAGGGRLLLVASDRVSAFDCVFPTPIPGKGRVLTALSAFWFARLGGIVANHLVAVPDRAWLERFGADPDTFEGRSLLVREVPPVPFECVVRGALEGSAFEEYRAHGTVGGHRVPEGLRKHDALPEPLFTPTTKATAGHDAPVSFAQVAHTVGTGTAIALRDTSIALFTAARDHVRRLGIELADTKFEFGTDASGSLVLIDEALTPDSSRYLVRDAEGRPVPMDKQFLRDWCLSTSWNREPPAPPIPAEVVEATAQRYRDIASRIIG
jgi:phosphoribosylaminoimidazole-succinocarboxamide synthase